MIKEIILEREDFDSLHDIILEVLDFKPTDSECQKFWDLLPEHIQGDALQWGTSDSIFGNNAFVWLRDNKETIKL